MELIQRIKGFLDEIKEILGEIAFSIGLEDEIFKEEMEKWFRKRK